MICRLIRHLVLVLFVALGLTACTQGFIFGPNSSASTSDYTNSTSKGHTNGYRPRGRRVGDANSGDASSNSIFNFNETPGTGNLWDRLRTNFQLAPADNNPRVQQQINWYMRHQGYLDRTVKRAAPYMYLIYQETKARDLPAELVLLPIMESAYNPFTRSSRGAVGLWQLMSSTAYGYGVKQDFWYDGRRDVYASTNAALDYLTYLQSFFGGDWLLAIGAYDAGEGRIQSAVHYNAVRGFRTDFWSLRLPAETQAYVPRLLALAAIINNPSRYHIVLPPINEAQKGFHLQPAY